jgi:hypothetical protein
LKVRHRLRDISQTLPQFPRCPSLIGQWHQVGATLLPGSECTTLTNAAGARHVRCTPSGATNRRSCSWWQEIRLLLQYKVEPDVRQSCSKRGCETSAKRVAKTAELDSSNNPLVVRLRFRGLARASALPLPIHLCGSSKLWLLPHQTDEADCIVSGRVGPGKGSRKWSAHTGSNHGHLACEANALTMSYARLSRRGDMRHVLARQPKFPRKGRPRNQVRRNGGIMPLICPTCQTNSENQ